MSAPEAFRKCFFRPYRKGMGPVFSLTLWEPSSPTYHGKNRVGYTLRMDGVILFDGDNFGCSPLHAVDSDETVASIMGFLTLRHGDTDAEYFEDYTPGQLAYCERFAESLACCVHDRFGDE